MDTVSVVIPCFKQAQFLPDAIESVLAQTNPVLEIIVIDDGSPDDVAAAASPYQSVRYIRQTNRGLAGARNRGLRECRGEYVLFLDSDDRILPDHVAISLEAFHQRPGNALVCGNYRWFGAPDTWHVHDCTPRPDFYGSLLRCSFNIPVHTALMWRGAVNQIGGFDETMTACEDTDFMLRFASNFSMYCHHQLVAEYRRHLGQMTRQPELILRGYRLLIRRHRGRINTDPRYREACRAGLHRMQQNFGEPVIWDLAKSLRSSSFRRALHDLRILLMYYPSGLMEHAWRKIWGRHREPQQQFPPLQPR